MYNDLYNNYDPYSEQGYFNPMMRQRLDNEITLNTLPFEKLNMWENGNLSPYERMGYEAIGLNNLGLGSFMSYPHRLAFADNSFGPNSSDLVDSAITDFRRPTITRDKFDAMKSNMDNSNINGDLRNYILQTAMSENPNYRNIMQAKDRFLNLMKNL